MVTSDTSLALIAAIIPDAPPPITITFIYSPFLYIYLSYLFRDLKMFFVLI